MKISQWLAACLLATLLCNCGYRVATKRTPANTGVSSIAIPMVTSPVTNLGFEGDFTRVVREYFAQRADIPLADEDQAGALLTIQILEVETTPFTYKVTRTAVDDETVTYRETRGRWLRLRLGARLTDRSSGAVLWEVADMEDKATYAVGQDPLSDRFSERQALLEIAGRLAEQMYSQSFEGF